MNVQRIRVPVGFLFAAAYLWFARPSPEAAAVGCSIAAVGLAMRAWAAGHLEKWRRLAHSGPYRRTRNPLYLGSFIMGLGFMLAGNALWLTALYITLFAALYWPVMRREEGELRQAYGQDFEDYRRRVPLFFPLLKRFPGREGGFSWQRFKDNREYKAVLGYGILVAIILVKMSVH